MWTCLCSSGEWLWTRAACRPVRRCVWGRMSPLAGVERRSAEALSARRLPAALMRDVAAFAMQDALDAGGPAHYDDWLPLAFAARDLKDDRFDDYIAALTASGPLVPVAKDVSR